MHVRLTLKQLDAFLKLEEAGSFRDASLILGVSQPALSRTIQQIESRLGTRLFDRDTRHVRLTAAGERLSPIATRLIREYNEAFNDLEAYITGKTGTVRLAVLPSVAFALLPGAIKRFNACHPGVSVDIWEDVGVPVHRSVEEGTADIGIAPPPSTSRNLSFRPIFRDDVVLVCRADDPLAARPTHDWHVFADRPFIGLSTDTGLRSLIDEALGVAGVKIAPLFHCRNPTTVGSLVAGSLGISALTRITTAQLGSPDLVWRTLTSPGSERPIGVVTNPARSLSQAARAFIKEIEAEARTLAARL